MRDTVKSSKELQVFLKSPIVKPLQKKAVLNELFSNKVSKTLQTFIDVLVNRGREVILLNVFEQFIKLYNEHAGIISVEVTSAMELGKEEVKKLTTSLEQRTGKKVELSFSVKPELRGGLMVRIEDTVIDGTVKRKLEELELLLYAKGA